MIDNALLLALIGLGATFVTSLTNLIVSYFRHTEVMRYLERVENNVNGKMEEFLTVQGAAREAIGKLAGIQTQKDVQIQIGLEKEKYE